MTPQKIKKTILVVISLLLLLPSLQFIVGIYKEERLGGFAFNPKNEKPKFTKKDWLSGGFQEKYEGWFNENFGFHHSFVRLNNQLNYSLFDTSKAFDVIVGKQGFLYYRNYLTAYTGGDYLIEDYLVAGAEKLKALQDTLTAKGITLVVAYAPGPASYYPEYLPAHFAKEGEHTIYKTMLRELQAKQINFIDFNAWFRQMKSATKYPLITHSGTHWSCYGVALAADSLVRYIGQKRKTEMPKLVKKYEEVTFDLRLPDNDIYATCNMLRPYRKERVAYPKWDYMVPAGKKPLKMLAVGDSYFDVMMRNTKITPACFEELDFWSYNEFIYRMDGSPAQPTTEVSAGEEIGKSQVLVLMATEANYGGMFWNFLDEAYDYYCLKKTWLPDPAVKKNRVNIMKDKGWFLAVQYLAQSEKISVDSALTRSARELAGK